MPRVLRVTKGDLIFDATQFRFEKIDEKCGKIVKKKIFVPTAKKLSKSVKNYGVPTSYALKHIDIHSMFCRSLPKHVDVLTKAFF